MSAEVRKRIVDLVSRARRLPLDQREAYLSQAFGSDRAAFAEAKRMLEQQDAVAGYSNGLVLELDEDALDAGTNLGSRYIVVRLAREEARFRIYDARDDQTGAAISIRQIIGTDDVARAAFESEVQVLQLLEHKALPPLIAALEDERGFFIVQQSSGLDDLSTFLAGAPSPFEPARVLKWAEQLLDVLVYLHDREEPVLHGRICPKYLRLTKGDDLLLLGLSRVASSADLSQLARAGDPEYGAPLMYAAPEVFAFRGGDERTDLYAVAATIYHLMTNEAPPTARQRETAIADGDPDPLRPANELNRHVSRLVAEIIHKALSLNPDERPESAAKLKNELSRVLRAVSAEQQLKHAPARPEAATVGTVPGSGRQPETDGMSQKTASAPVQHEALPDETISRILKRDVPPQNHLVRPAMRTSFVSQYTIGLLLSWMAGGLVVVGLVRFSFLFTHALLIGALIAGYAQASVLRRELDSQWWWRLTMIGYGAGALIGGFVLGDPGLEVFPVLRVVGTLFITVSVAQFMALNQRVLSAWIWIGATVLSFAVGVGLGTGVARFFPESLVLVGYLTAAVLAVGAGQSLAFLSFHTKIPFERSSGTNK